MIPIELIECCTPKFTPYNINIDNNADIDRHKVIYLSDYFDVIKTDIDDFHSNNSFYALMNINRTNRMYNAIKRANLALAIYLDDNIDVTYEASAISSIMMNNSLAFINKFSDRFNKETILGLAATFGHIHIVKSLMNNTSKPHISYHVILNAIRKNHIALSYYLAVLRPIKLKKDYWNKFG